jgi:hypothetical protein
MVATPQCSNCLFSFVAPASANAVSNPPNRAVAGALYCNRQAPAPPNALNPSGWLWPLVAADWWCGEGADLITGLSYASIVNGVPGANGAGYGGTSATSATIANSGSVSLTTQSGLAYQAGARVRATSTGSGAWMEGVVTSYSGAGVLVFTADTASGSGTHTDWSINVAGQPGTGGVRSSGTFTAAVAASTTVNDVNATTGSKIFIFPTDASAATLMSGAGSFYVSAINNGVSFTLTTANGSFAAGSETFTYIIV